MPTNNAQSEPSSRVTTRVPPIVRDTLQRGADLSGATLNQFLVRSALKEAEALIERETVIRLSGRDAEIFLDALENPPPANARLKAAARKSRKS
ncbi:MAG TPA: DUF1778 domain-containing protein [Gammaproteobacteria bacterium]|nr:DUF1778 domain-containing protein [Gammaproteobacteria bacterium]